MLKEKLKQALKQKGLNEGLAEIVTIENEEQIEDIVTQLSTAGVTPPNYEEVLASEEFATYVEEQGFDKVLGLSKTIQKFHDKKVTDGVTTAIKNHQKKNGMPNNDPKPNEGKDGDQVPEYIKTLMDDIKSLKDEKAKTQFTTTASEAFNKTKLPKKWFNRIVEGEVSVEDQIKELESEYNEIHTSIVAGNAGSGLPGGGSGSGEANKEEVDEIIGDLV